MTIDLEEIRRLTRGDGKVPSTPPQVIVSPHRVTTTDQMGISDESLERYMELKKKRSYHKPHQSKRSKNPQGKLGEESTYMDESTVAEIRLDAYRTVKRNAERHIIELEGELKRLKNEEI